MKVNGRPRVRGVAKLRLSALWSGLFASIAEIDLSVRAFGFHPPFEWKLSIKNDLFRRWLPKRRYISKGRSERPLWVSSSRTGKVGAQFVRALRRFLKLPLTLVVHLDAE